MYTASLIIILIASMFLFSVGLMSIIQGFVKIICFWGEVLWEDSKSIKYKFDVRWFVVYACIGFVGVLYSVVALAIRLHG